MIQRRMVLLAVSLFILLIAEVFYFKLFVSHEHRLSDFFISQQVNTHQPDADIVIVDIDEKSLSMLADTLGRWPWSRSVHAELLQGLLKQQPKAVVFDILFSDPDLNHPEADQYFADVIKQSAQVYFPMLLLDDVDPKNGIALSKYGAALGIMPTHTANKDAAVSMVLPLESILGTHQLGTHNILTDKKDGMVRSYPVFTNKQGWLVPSLPAKVVKGLGGVVPHQPSIRVQWVGRDHPYLHVSFADLFLDFQRQNPVRDPYEFKDKIIIIGSTATGLHDVRTTPVAAFHPGVEILANAIDNLKNSDSLRETSPYLAISLGLILLSSLVYGLSLQRYLLRTGGWLILSSVLLFTLSYALIGKNYIVELLTPILFAWVFYLIIAVVEYLNERKAKELAVATFSRFLDPRVVQSLVDKGETMASMSGKSREISVLFSDIRGFTSLSEKSTPEQVVELLNEYFSLQAKAIFESGGTLDKYIGDAIMAFWGAPTEMSDHALRAVETALVMSEKLIDFRAACVAKGMLLGNDLDVGIGVHSGSAVVGFIGSESKLDYTAIGDTVNLSSRIEGLTKGIARVLVSEHTREMCLKSERCPYEFVTKGSFQVKGREQLVNLYEPIRISKT